jgi:hypothetical protein
MSSKKESAYEPPRAMRMGGQRSAAGDCSTPGSGDSTCVAPGSSAVSSCTSPGNSAALDPFIWTLGCVEVGNAAGGFCYEPGSGVVDKPSP